MFHLLTVLLYSYINFSNYKSHKQTRGYPPDPNLYLSSSIRKPTTSLIDTDVHECTLFLVTLFIIRYVVVGNGRLQKAREDGDIAPDIVQEMLMIQGTPNQHLAVVHVHPAVSSRFGAKLPMMQC